MVQRTATIKVVRKKGKTVISNDKGNKWGCIGNMPERYTIGALIYFTLEKAFEDIQYCNDEFEIELTIKQQVNYE